MMDYTEKAMKEGKQRLKRLLPQCLKDAKKSRLDKNFSVEKSLMAHVIVRYAKPSNLQAVVVYRTEKGWYADLVLKKVGRGNSNVMGTPASHPHMTKAEAEEGARQIMVVAIAGWMDFKEQNRSKPVEDERVFKLHGFDFSVPGKIIDTLSDVWDQQGTTTLGDEEDARGRLVMNLTAMMGEDCFDPEIWNAASKEEKMAIVANMATLLIFGHQFHPQRTPQILIPDVSVH
jgi:hypothetical protein